MYFYGEPVGARQAEAVDDWEIVNGMLLLILAELTGLVARRLARLPAAPPPAATPAYIAIKQLQQSTVDAY